MGALWGTGGAPNGCRTCKQHLSLPCITAHLADPSGSRGTRKAGVWRQIPETGASLQPAVEVIPSSPFLPSPEAKVGLCSCGSPPRRSQISGRRWVLGSSSVTSQLDSPRQVSKPIWASVSVKGEQSHLPHRPVVRFVNAFRQADVGSSPYPFFTAQEGFEMSPALSRF